MKDKICIVGLGYVGLPLAVAFAEKYTVAGFDINERRVNELRSGVDATCEVPPEALQGSLASLRFTADIKEVDDCNIYIITVPTPIDKANLPDLTPLILASASVGSVLKKGDIVIYESTVYPGVTEETCVPKLESVSGLTFNQDFYCGYSPERINPGDKNRGVKDIVKVTSGSTPKVAEQIDALYRSIITAGTHLASSIKVAEASKVIENTQRDVNIALVNELALIFAQMNIDTNEVLTAAATKWNFIHLTPGLVGGHCIGVDPYYLTYKAEELGYSPNLILASRQINNSMSKYIAEQTIKCMIAADKKIKGARVLILGVTFKEDCPDMRNSKVIDIIKELSDYGVCVEVYDPWVAHASAKNADAYHYIDNPMQAQKKYEAIIVAVGHKQFKDYTMDDYQKISQGETVIMDVKNQVEKPTWRL